MSYIYAITNQINNKTYIGQTSQTIEQRFKQHCYDAKNIDKSNRPLYKAMQKYGEENFSIHSIEICDASIVDEREKYWIEYFGTFKNGYNATLGGDGKPYADYDLIYNLYQSGKNCKEIIEITQYSDKTVRRALENFNVTKADRQSICGTYQNTVIKMLNKDTNEILQIFPSIKDAYAFLNKRRSSHIQEVCKGSRKQAYGYKWSF